MNILLINHYAGSPDLGMDYRPYYLAREWVRAGHSVTIVAASFAHTRRANPEALGPVTLEVIDGIQYAWLRTPAYQGNGPGRILNMASFVAGLFRHLAELTRPWAPQVVVASSTYPLDFYPARWIARRHHARLAFELHDLWPLTLKELGRMSRFNPFIAVMQAAEDAWCRDCDVAVSILPYADRHLRTRGLRPEKFVHVPNGIDLDEWAEASPPLPPGHRAFLDRQRSTGRFLVGYAGAHGISNALDVLVDAAARLREQPIDLALVGSGPERERLMARAGKLGLGNLTFLDALPKAVVPEWLVQMDCLFLGFRASPLYMFGVSPNKLFDYMMAGKPIICAISAGNDPVAEAGCGVSVPADDPGALAEGILALHRASPGERLAMGLRGRAHILANHTYPQLAARFLDAITQVPS